MVRPHCFKTRESVVQNRQAIAVLFHAGLLKRHSGSRQLVFWSKDE